MINTTFLTIWGPGLALRGPEGSMKRAVEGMLHERQHIYFAFGLGLFALILSAIAYTWAQVNQSREAIPLSVTAMLLLALTFIIYSAYHVVQRFVLPSETTISGDVNQNSVWDNEIVNAWSQAYDTNNSSSLTGKEGRSYEPPKEVMKLVSAAAHDPNTRFDISGIPHQMKGVLAKQSQWSRQWQSALYVLSGTNLYVFKSEQDPVPLRNRPVELAGYDVTYDMKTNSRSFKLIPKSEDDERRIWELRAEDDSKVPTHPPFPPPPPSSSLGTVQ